LRRGYRHFNRRSGLRLEGFGRGGGAKFFGFGGRRLFFGHRPGGFFDDADRAPDGRVFLGKILVANFLGKFLRNRIRGHADIDTFTPYLFDKALGIDLQIFCEIVKADF
jgi:hypothetical protein